jgi:hypothetical protein
MKFGTEVKAIRCTGCLRVIGAIHAESQPARCRDVKSRAVRDGEHYVVNGHNRGSKRSHADYQVL